MTHADPYVLLIVSFMVTFAAICIGEAARVLLANRRRDVAETPERGL